MAKNKIQEYASAANSNSDVAGVNIAEGCAPGGINNALRSVMAHIKTALSGSDDSLVTGTAGANGELLAWNSDGDAVSGGTVTGTYDFSGATVTGLSASAPPDANYGDVTVASGVWSLNADVVSPAEMADGDFGAFTFASGVATLDDGVVTPAKLADADFGGFTVSSGVATVVSGSLAILAAEYTTGATAVDMPTSWTALEINTERYDGIGVTLSSNQIVFASAGTYAITATLAARNISGGGRSAQLRAYNATTAAVIDYGNTMNTQNASMGTITLQAVATVSDSDAVEIQGIATGNNLQTFYSYNQGGEVGLQIEIRKLS